MNASPGEGITALARRATLAAIVGVLSGAASAGFLAMLDLATTFRLAHPWLVFGLPFAGLAMGVALQRWGGRSLGGSSLVLEIALKLRGPAQGESPSDPAAIPLSMTPIVLLGTVWTHLFGGSAGREGTAVQMGASLGDTVAHRAKVDRHDRRLIILSGVAGGFGSVFGTPCAGTIFALEVTRTGRIEGEALVPALVASFVGDLVTRGLGTRHSTYLSPSTRTLDLRLVGIWIAFGVAMGLAARVFVLLAHWVKQQGDRFTKSLGVRMMVGGALVVAIARLTGRDDILGLGVPTIQRAFFDPTLPASTFALKIVVTAITIGCGFVGGEVTPLFFVGATLGNLLARIFDVPLPLAAGVGLAAVFGAAANTPLALTIMVAELLGSGALPHALPVCVVAYLVSGHRSIYGTQHLVATKWGGRVEGEPRSMRSLGEHRE